MALTLFFTDFAKRKLKEIYIFYKEESKNSAIARKFVDSIVDYSNILTSEPEMGQMEELLLDRAEVFRYIVFKHYKIVYWINKSKNRIDISHIFDTRQNPFKIRRLK